MTITRLLKQRFISTLTILLITLHISACGGSGGSATETFDSEANSGISNNQNAVMADINLSWVAPAERENNSPIALSEITGYKILYGIAQGQYSNSVTINDSTAVNYTFADFPAGTYYFVVTTLDTEGRESRFSPEVVVVI